MPELTGGYPVHDALVYGSTGQQIVGDGTNTTRTAPFIDIQGGSATIENPRFAGIGTGSGNAISVSTDGTHDITVNALNGWGIALPATISNGQYGFDRTFTATPTVIFATPDDNSFIYST